MERDEILLLLENQLVAEAHMRKKREHLMELHAQEKILQVLRERITESSPASSSSLSSPSLKLKKKKEKDNTSVHSLAKLNELLEEIQSEISNSLQFFEGQSTSDKDSASSYKHRSVTPSPNNSASLVLTAPPSLPLNEIFSPFNTRFKGKIIKEEEMEKQSQMRPLATSSSESEMNFKEELTGDFQWDDSNSKNSTMRRRQLPPPPEIQVSDSEYAESNRNEERNEERSESHRDKNPPPVPPRSKFGSLKMRLTGGFTREEKEKESPKTPKSRTTLDSTTFDSPNSSPRPTLTSTLSVPVLTPTSSSRNSNPPSPNRKTLEAIEEAEKDKVKLTLSGTLASAFSAFKGKDSDTKRERSRSFNSPPSSPPISSSSNSLMPGSKDSKKSIGRSRGSSFDDEQGIPPTSELLMNKDLSQRQIRLARGILYIQINSASNLYSKGGSTVNPYYVITFNEKSSRSKVLKNCTNAEWPEEIFQFNVDPSSPAQLFVDVYNHHKFSANKRLGRAVISILDLLEENEFDRYIPLVSIKESDNVSGGLNVSVKFSPDTMGEQIESKEDMQIRMLFSAIQNSDVVTLDRILSEKIDPNAKDKYGFSLLHAACMVYSEHDEDILMRILHLNGLQIDTVNNDKNTPLHYFAAYFRNPNCSRPFATFVKKGANLNAKNTHGETPLHKAIFNNSIRTIIIDLLLQAGSNVNAVNNLNETVLYYAVRNQAGIEVIKTLLRRGADYTIKDSKLGLSPVDLAMRQDDQQVKYVLQKTQAMCEWLDQIGMDRYKKNFLKEDMNLDVLCSVDSIDMELDLGIIILPHQVIINKAILKLKEERKKANVHNETSTARPESPPPEEGEFVFSLTAPPGMDTDLDDYFVPNGRLVRNSSSFTMVDQSEEDINLHWQRELNKLEYIKDHGSWVLNSSDIEYTVKLGEGSFGDVFKGLYKGKQEVAVKVLRKKPELLEEFKKEFQINCTLRSPYVVYFLGICLGPKTCIVMEYCSHGSLYSVLKDPQFQFTWESFFKASREILLGLNYLHSHDPQILHRDMKTPNLMVTSDFTVKMADFGTSRFNITSEQNTLVQVRGSKAYTAPELFFGLPFTVKSDIFSVSIILWEMAMRILRGTWVAPYSEYNQLRHDYQIYYQVSKMDKRNTIPSNCPPSISELIQRCWKPDSTERPDSQETLDKLASIQAEWKKNQKSWDKLADGREKTK
eukprot:TRINITY_DN4046_c0_g1_i2.p1 TRINITY_DN4046_c0_g1~~TRINITY_DN4046_c0_g1_i2.p1  ORF type:complete len:1200 (+),score=409.74 TRINITY_DN4046_c0_g1_i2:88-3687(+)